jgi:hypothetical protein
MYSPISLEDGLHKKKLLEEANLVTKKNYVPQSRDPNSSEDSKPQIYSNNIFRDRFCSKNRWVCDLTQSVN